MSASLLFADSPKKQNEEYYLIDSLDLSQLSDGDRQLIDSSLLSYYNCASDTCKLRAISNIVEESWDQKVWPKYNRWIKEFVEERLTTALDSNDRSRLNKYLAGALNNMGYLQSSIGNIELAIDYFEQSISLYKKIKDEAGLASSFINLGHIYDNQGLLSKALDCYFESLSLQEKLNNRAGVATALNGIGYLYYKQGEKESALENYLKSLEIRREIKDDYGISTCLNNIGLLYKDEGELEKSKKYYLQCLRLDKKINSKKGVSTSLMNLGSIAEVQKKLEEALDYYNKGLKIVVEIEDKNGIAYAYNNIANVYLKKGLTSKAEDNALKALKIAQEISFPKTIRNAAETLSKVYKEKENWEKSLEFYELYTQFKDSINNQETKREAIHKAYHYQYAKKAIADSIQHVESERLKEAELHLVKKEKESIELIAEKREQQLFFLLAGLVITLFLIGFVYSRLRIIQSQKSIITSQKEKLEASNKQIELSNREIKSRNNEITDSIIYAQQIQNALMKNSKPSSFPVKDMFVSYLPKDLISGDFYWMVTQEEYVYIAIGDCTGHGVPGALLTMLGMSMLNEISASQKRLTPSEILEELRGKILKELNGKDQGNIKDGMDMAVVRLDTKTNQLLFSGAFRPLLLVKSSGFELVKGDRQCIGHNYKKIPFTDVSFNLYDGDAVYIFSDGYADQFGEKTNKKFRNKMLLQLLFSLKERTMSQQKEAVESTFQDWKGCFEQTDDVVIVGFKI